MNWRIIIFGLLITAQVAVPFRMIQQRETVLRKGELFRFKTEPIDPADPFQGRYVWLRIEDNYVTLSEDVVDHVDRRSYGYATISVDDKGFAHFAEWTLERPEITSYLKTRASGHARTWDPETEKSSYKGLRIEIPFTRFYMDEAKAPRAEILARDATRNEDCWVEVRILNGKAVIEDVIAEGQSLRDLASIEK